MKPNLTPLLLAAAFLPGIARGADAIPYGEFPLGENGDALVAHVEAVRGKPLTEIATGSTLSASEFGAVPDDGKDDLPALRALFAEATARGKCKAVIGPGVYHLLSADDDKNAFDLVGGADIVIEGAGAELRHGNPKSGFFGIRDCKRMILRGFTTDYDPPPFTQGRIVAVDKKARTFDFQVDEGFPLSDRTFFEGRNQIFGFLMDKRPEFRGRLKAGATHSVRVEVPGVRSEIPSGAGGPERNRPGTSQGPETVGERTVRLRTIDGRIQHFEVGDLYVQLARSGTTQWVLYNNSEDITFQDITIHAAGAAVFIGSVCERVNILGCKIVPRGGRLISANGGGAIAQSHGRGIWVEGCRFESISDDPVNFYSKPIFALAPAEGGGLHMKGASPDRLAAGDEVAFFDTSEGKTIFRTRVVSNRKGVVAFDPPVDPATLEMCGDPKETKDEKLKKFDYLMNLRLQSDYYVVRNNEFINCRGRVLLRASRGVVEGNTVRGSAMGGAVLINDWVCPEGYRVTDAVFRDNTFEECGLVTDDSGSSMIVFVRYPRPGDPFDAPSDSREHRNVLFQNNTFKNWFRTPGFSIHGITKLRMTGNTFLREASHPYAQSPDAPVIRIENSGDIRFEENICRAGEAKFLEIGERCEGIEETGTR